MPKFSGKIPIFITAGSCIFAALLLLMLPLQWVVAAAAAAGFHELCHISAIYLLGGRVTGFTLGSGGAAMEIEPISKTGELLCALAGPFGGLLLLLFARWIPRVAVCAAVQSLYNLLPVYPLDGGRALRCGAALILPRRSDRFCAALEYGCLIFLLLLGLYGCFWLRLGIIPLIFVAAIWFKRKNTLQTRPGLSTIVTAIK